MRNWRICTALRLRSRNERAARVRLNRCVAFRRSVARSVTGVEPPPLLPQAAVVLRKPIDAGLVAKIIEDYFVAGPQLS